MMNINVIGSLFVILLSFAFRSDGQTFQGDGTFYGAGGAGSQGSCMLESGFNEVPMTVAMNPFQYNSGMSCGKCIRAWGDGQGLGMTPIIGPFFATIDNLCPECKFGDVDFGLAGDGRWSISWEFIPCDDARDHYRRLQYQNKKNLRGMDQENFGS